MYGVETSDPKQGTYTPTDVSGIPAERFDENGFPYPSELPNEVFVDQNGVKWYFGSGKWHMNGTGSVEEAAPPTHDHGDTTVPGAY